MPDITYPYAVKYKGRYYAAGERIEDSNEGNTHVAISTPESQAKAPRRKASKKPSEAEVQPD